MSLAKLNPKREAQKILQKCEISTAPVPIEDIANFLGAKVVHSRLDDEHCGMIYLEEGRVIIGVNSKHHLNRQRFTIAHEIGHLIMHKEQILGTVHIDRSFGEKLNRDGRSALGEDLKEIQANRFAAELLIPTPLIKKEIESDRLIDFQNDDFIDELAEKYEVSSQSMSIKIQDIFS